MITVFVGVEDDLSFRVATNLILKVFGNRYAVQRLHAKRAGGHGQIRGNIEKYIKLARHQPVVLITDLDNHECAPSLIAAWLAGRNLSSLLSFRVAVREIESWLMADRANFANFLRVSEARIPREVEIEDDPKARLIGIARNAHKNVRGEIVRSSRNGFTQALGYNDALSKFVDSEWDFQSAAQQSNSLRRAIESLIRLKNAIEVQHA